MIATSCGLHARQRPVARAPAKDMRPERPALSEVEGSEEVPLGQMSRAGLEVKKKGRFAGNPALK